MWRDHGLEIRQLSDCSAGHVLGQGQIMDKMLEHFKKGVRNSQASPLLLTGKQPVEYKPLCIHNIIIQKHIKGSGKLCPIQPAQIC